MELIKYREILLCGDTLLFGDTILCYHRKIKQLILGRYCRYHKIFEAWSIADFQARFS
jgi:hypothetical protein